MRTEQYRNTTGPVTVAIETLVEAFGTRFEVVVQPPVHDVKRMEIVRPVSVIVGNVEYRLVAQETSLGLDKDALQSIIEKGASTRPAAVLSAEEKFEQLKRDAEMYHGAPLDESTLGQLRTVSGLNLEQFKERFGTDRVDKVQECDDKSQNGSIHMELDIPPEEVPAWLQALQTNLGKKKDPVTVNG